MRIDEFNQVYGSIIKFSDPGLLVTASLLKSIDVMEATISHDVHRWFCTVLILLWGVIEANYKVIFDTSRPFINRFVSPAPRSVILKISSAII